VKNKGFKLLNYLFLGIFFFLFLLVVKPSLVFFLQQIGFSTTESFFVNYASYPGGLAEYISIFLFQFYSKAFLGAIVATLLFFIIFIIANSILSKGNKLFNGILGLCPLAFLAFSMTDYLLDPIFPVQILLLFIFFYLFKLISDKGANTYLKMVLSTIVFIVAYYFSGGFIFLVLLASSLLYVVFTQKKEVIYLGSLMLALAAFLPFIAKSVFFINVSDAYFRFVPFFSTYKPGFFLYAAVLSLPIMILVQNVIPKLLKNTDEKGFWSSYKFQKIQIGFMIVILIAGMIGSLDRTQKHKVTVNYLAHQNKWEKLLKVVEKKPSDDRVIQFQTTRALYHTGQLPEKLLDYPQVWGVDGLLLSRYFQLDIIIPTTEFYLDLGFINEAIHYANEAISLTEFSPIVIEQLILSNIIAKKYEAAKLYINQLKTIPFNKRKAESYERYLKTGDNSTIDSFVREKRNLMPIADFRINKMYPQDDLYSILNDRPDNKMAYEYLMVFYLLNNDLYTFSEYYKLGKRFNYKNVPKLFQEALVLLAYDLRSKGQAVGNQYFDQGIVSQFNDYLSVLGQYNGDKDLAKAALKKQFSNTYWYYINYNSPVTNKSKIVTE